MYNLKTHLTKLIEGDFKRLQITVDTDVFYSNTRFKLFGLEFSSWGHAEYTNNRGVMFLGIAHDWTISDKKVGLTYLLKICSTLKYV
jgi:hypothetical protein